jgi:hypothetical protein
VDPIARLTIEKDSSLAGIKKGANPVTPFFRKTTVAHDL